MVIEKFKNHLSDEVQKNVDVDITESFKNAMDSTISSFLLERFPYSDIVDEIISDIKYIDIDNNEYEFIWLGNQGIRERLYRVIENIDDVIDIQSASLYVIDIVIYEYEHEVIEDECPINPDDFGNVRIKIDRGRMKKIEDISKRINRPLTDTIIYILQSGLGRIGLLEISETRIL